MLPPRRRSAGASRPVDVAAVLAGDGSVVPRHILRQGAVRVAWLRHGGLLDGLSRPWVEDGREHVANEQAEQHGERDEEEEGLHDRVVEAFHRPQQEAPESRVVEDVLDEDGPRHHEAECHGEARQIGEDGVPSGVGPHDPPALEPFRPGHADVVLCEHRDRVVPHEKDPQADLRDEDRHAREDRVPQHVADEGQVPGRGVGEDVVGVFDRAAIRG